MFITVTVTGLHAAAVVQVVVVDLWLCGLVVEMPGGGCHGGTNEGKVGHLVLLCGEGRRKKEDERGSSMAVRRC